MLTFFTMLTFFVVYFLWILIVALAYYLNSLSSKPCQDELPANEPPVNEPPVNDMFAYPTGGGYRIIRGLLSANNMHVNADPNIFIKWAGRRPIGITLRTDIEVFPLYELAFQSEDTWTELLPSLPYLPSLSELPEIMRRVKQLCRSIEDEFAELKKTIFLGDDMQNQYRFKFSGFKSYLNIRGLKNFFDEYHDGKKVLVLAFSGCFEKV
jgi:hypothetical protein